jgi:hypothetical protein
VQRDAGERRTGATAIAARLAGARGAGAARATAHTAVLPRTCATRRMVPAGEPRASLGVREAGGSMVVLVGGRIVSDFFELPQRSRQGL